MSQPDLLDRLRDERPVAPPELRDRVRLIAAQAPAAPQRRITWQRSLVVLVPIAAAILAAVVLFPSSGKRATPVLTREGVEGAARPPGSQSFAAAAAKAAPSPLLAPSSTRPQRYSATLSLQLPTPAALSSASRRAVAIAASLSGYQQKVTLNAGNKRGYAEIVLRIPRANVPEAIRRLSALGRITSENVSSQDLQTQLNATDQLIDRLQRQLAALRATTPQTTSVTAQIASVTRHIQSLQRNQAATRRTAHYATISLQLSTPPPATPKPHKPGPLHGLGIAFHWIWIGAVYALALGLPLLALLTGCWFLIRSVRRRREDRLLSHR